jgi:hypothetical protein
MRASPIAINNPTTPFERIRRQTVSGSSRIGGFVDSSFSASKNFISSTLDVGVKVSKIILGFLGLAGGAIAAAIFKENTAADWGSKVLMIAGAVLGILGVKDLINYNKDIGQKIESEPCYTEVSPDDSRRCKEAIAELNAQDRDPRFGRNYDQNEPGFINRNEFNPAIRTSAIKLLKAYISTDLVKHSGTYRSGTEYQITNIDSQNIALSEYGDRIGLLLGYISASGPLDNTDPEARDLVSSILQDVENRYRPASVFNYDVAGKGYARALPTDFRDAYIAAQWYRSCHSANDSGNVAIGDHTHLAQLQSALTSPPGPTRDAAYNYLVQVQNTQNYLVSLERIIKYVLNPQNLADPVKARNVIVLRQALICGLGLKGNNVDAINQELEKILLGEEGGAEGLTTKLQIVSNHINSEAVSSVINDQRFPFERRASNISGDDVLGGMTWHEIVKKKN